MSILNHLKIVAGMDQTIGLVVWPDREDKIRATADNLVVDILVIGIGRWCQQIRF